MTLQTLCSAQKRVAFLCTCCCRRRVVSGTLGRRDSMLSRLVPCFCLHLHASRLIVAPELLHSRLGLPYSPKYHFRGLVSMAGAFDFGSGMPLPPIVGPISVFNSFQTHFGSSRAQNTGGNQPFEEPPPRSDRRRGAHSVGEVLFIVTVFTHCLAAWHATAAQAYGSGITHVPGITPDFALLHPRN